MSKLQPVLIKIKRLIIAKKYSFTLKAETEMFADLLTEDQVLEAILNANGIKKVIRSTSPHRQPDEKLYVIESFTYDGLLIYTKGTIKKDQQGQQTYYLLVSSKRSTFD